MRPRRLVLPTLLLILGLLLSGIAVHVPAATGMSDVPGVIPDRAVPAAKADQSRRDSVRTDHTGKNHPGRRAAACG
jgi:hypothetical protein